MSSVLSHALTPVNEYRRISVSPIAGALGAEISGVDSTKCCARLHDFLLIPMIHAGINDSRNTTVTIRKQSRNARV